MIKDYYKILDITPSASIKEIKRAYRRLAQQYHPDKNSDAYAAVQFAAIKEAYEVLTNPTKKEYYLQQRWYNQSINKRRTQEIITPELLLRQSLELERYVSTLDTFRMDKQGLKEYILGLLQGTTIETLHTFNEPGTVKEITSIILRAMQPLPQTLTGEIAVQLEKLAAGNQAALQQIQTFTQKAAQKNRREKYSLVIIIAITIVLCLMIWLAGK